LQKISAIWLNFLQVLSKLLQFSPQIFQNFLQFFPQFPASFIKAPAIFSANFPELPVTFPNFSTIFCNLITNSCNLRNPSGSPTLNAIKFRCFQLCHFFYQLFRHFSNQKFPVHPNFTFKKIFISPTLDMTSFIGSHKPKLSEFYNPLRVLPN
jgi:hypothetical protein